MCGPSCSTDSAAENRKHGERRICIVCRNDGDRLCEKCTWLYGMRRPMYFDKIQGLRIPDDPKGLRQ